MQMRFLLNNSKTTKIKFGQIWRAKRDYKIAIYSPHQNCIIPKNTRVIVLNTPVNGAIGFDIMSLTSKGLDRKLIPNLKQMETSKEGFGITVNRAYFKRHFILDKDQKIKFDNIDSEIFWKQVSSHRNLEK